MKTSGKKKKKKIIMITSVRGTGSVTGNQDFSKLVHYMQLRQNQKNIIKMYGDKGATSPFLQLGGLRGAERRRRDMERMIYEMEDDEDDDFGWILKAITAGGLGYGIYKSLGDDNIVKKKIKSILESFQMKNTVNRINKFVDGIQKGHDFKITEKDSTLSNALTRLEEVQKCIAEKINEDGKHHSGNTTKEKTEKPEVKGKSPDPQGEENENLKANLEDLKGSSEKLRQENRSLNGLIQKYQNSQTNLENILNELSQKNQTLQTQYTNLYKTGNQQLQDLMTANKNLLQEGRQKINILTIENENLKRESSEILNRGQIQVKNVKDKLNLLASFIREGRDFNTNTFPMFPIEMKKVLETIYRKVENLLENIIRFIDNGKFNNYELIKKNFGNRYAKTVHAILQKAVSKERLLKYFRNPNVENFNTMRHEIKDAIFEYLLKIGSKNTLIYFGNKLKNNENRQKIITSTLNSRFPGWQQQQSRTTIQGTK